MWNPILYKKTLKVITFFDSEIKQVVQDLIDTVRSHNVIWLSANQIWVNKSIFVTEIRKTKYRDVNDIDWVRIFINPKIIFYSDEKVIDYEWCGSVSHSDFFAEVERSENIIIKAFDEKWDEFELKADWLLARVIQHEYDHLNWVLFTEKIVDITKAMSWDEWVKRKLEKI